MIRRARIWWAERSEAAADEFVDVVIDRAPLWLLIGVGILIVTGLPTWISESIR